MEQNERNVGGDDTKTSAMTRRPTIGDRFEEARELFRSENYRLPQVRRRSRRG